MNVIHLKHDQLKINVAEFSDLGEEASNQLSFAISSFFSKTLYWRRLHMLINLRYFKVFTGTSSLLKANQFPSTHASTSQACYSPNQMHFSHPYTLSSLICPILLKLGMEEKDFSSKVRTKKRKMFSGIWHS